MLSARRSGVSTAVGVPGRRAFSCLFLPASRWVAAAVRGLLAPLAVCWLCDPLLCAADEPYGRHQFDESARQHWAFVSPVRHTPPPEADGARNRIDAFILSGLKQAGLQPAPPCEPRVLLRRVYLDLIGLAPTPAEQAAYLTDRSPDALSRVVEDLLSRPEYGERWARHWLDVVRYAESNGYERDGAKPNVWRYRDWVIQAFNKDKPYDRFLAEQLAGDELNESDAESQIGATFLRLGTWDDEPADPDVDRYDQLDDIVGATSATFMAQTVRCARCHDHKFESFTQRDYSRLLAVFSPLKRPQDGRTDLDRPVGTAAELAAYKAALDQAEQHVKRARQSFEDCEWRICQRLSAAGALTVAAGGGPGELTAEAIAAFQVAPASRSEEQQNQVKKYRGKLRSLLDKAASPEEVAELKQGERQAQDAEGRRPAPLTAAYIWYEEGPQSGPTHVLKRGDPRQPQETVDPGVPAILVDAPLPPPPPAAASTGRRRQLAAWLTQPDNPLTARVMVNRIWQHHFGDGLVGSENDFGVMGEAPTHPELLDWLATEFVAGGWSVKHMHRLMVLSNAYQMSSAIDPVAQAKDPENDLLWHFAPRRLEAETVRDLILAASGQLNRRQGGPSVYPTISPAVLASQSRPGNGWGKSEPADAARRSVYVFVKRTLLVPELEVLDFPDTNGVCEQRRVSTVAPQALTFLNGEFIHEQARHFAQRLADFSADPAERVRQAYLLSVSREPLEAERAAVSEFVAAQERQIAADAQAAGQPADDAAQKAWQAFCLVLFNTNEFVYLP